MGKQEYMEPVSPWALTTQQEKTLRTEAQELRHLVENPATPWRERTNAEARLGEVERVLKAADHEKRLTQARQQRMAPTQQVQNGRVRLIRSDDGKAFLVVGGTLSELVK